MPGEPQRGDTYRQEYFPRYALDQARVLGPGGSVTVPNGSYPDTLLTVETARNPNRASPNPKCYSPESGNTKDTT